MADVELKCEKCGRTVKVSQFARMDTVTCPDCGSSVAHGKEVAKKADAQVKKTTLVVKKKERTPRKEEPDGTEEQIEERDSTFDKTMKAVPKSNRTEKRRTRHLYSWVLFLVLAPIAFLCRYQDLIPNLKDFGLAYGGWILLFWHVILILMAFKDDTFQGILCLLVPGYSLYYLFLVSDAFYVRAIVTAVLIAFGQDGGIQIGEYLGVLYDSISSWIGSGGGEIRR